MSLGPDNSNKAQDRAITHAGIGLKSAKRCMPCGKNVMNQAGGGYHFYRGAQKVWHCPACNAARVAA